MLKNLSVRRLLLKGGGSFRNIVQTKMTTTTKGALNAGKFYGNKNQNTAVRSIACSSSPSSSSSSSSPSSSPSSSSNSTKDHSAGSEETWKRIAEDLKISRSFREDKFETGGPKPLERRYHWITEEAQVLIARAYARHHALVRSNMVPTELTDRRKVEADFPPALGVSDLEALGHVYHYPPKTFSDRVALRIIQVLEKLMHVFFREKHDHHAVTLETLAAVPGYVASMHRHLRSLRNMEQDHGWLNHLLEEGENERMHLLIFMQMTQPTRLERAMVIFAQGAYVTFYNVLYLLSPKTAHRSVGYLEECAVRAYNDYLESIDNGSIPNRPAGTIAKWYYHLPEDATLRDVVLRVRADECCHRDTNHHMGEVASVSLDEEPITLEKDLYNNGIDIFKMRELERVRQSNNVSAENDVGDNVGGGGDGKGGQSESLNQGKSKSEDAQGSKHPGTVSQADK